MHLRILSIVTLVLALVGMSDASWLVALSYADQAKSFLCANDAACASVLRSDYATVFGWPLALLGVFGYAAMVVASLGLMASSQVCAHRFWLRVLRALASVAAGMGVALTLLQATVLDAWCTLCLLSAAISGLLALCVWSIRREEPKESPPGPASWFFRGAALASFVVACALLVTLLPRKQQGDPVIAQLPGADVRQSDLDRWFSHDRARRDAQRSHREHKLLETLARRRVLEREARRRNVEVATLLAQAEAKDRDQFFEQLFAAHEVHINDANVYAGPAKLDYAQAQMIGPSDARLTFAVFSDFECPYCRRLHAALHEARRQWPRDIRIALFHYPLDTHPGAWQAAEVAWCAGEQGKLEVLLDRFATLGAPTSSGTPGVDERMQAAARDVGLDPVAQRACLLSGRARDAIGRHMDAFEALKLDGIPVLFVNGWRASSILDFADLEPIILMELELEDLRGPG